MRLRSTVMERNVRLKVGVVAATPALVASKRARLWVRHPSAGAPIGPTGGSFASSDGRIRVEVPAGALTQTVQMSYTPRQHLARQGAFYTFDLGARTAAGADVTDFARPLTVTLRYTDRDVAGLGEGSLRLAWSREAANGQPRQSGQWPSSVYTPTNTLVARVSHFSEQQAEGEPRTIVPATINDFQVGLFSGSASFGLPLDLPPGAAGLKPALTLRYDSSRVNQMYRRYSQAGWVGTGWGLDLGAIRWTDPEGSDLDHAYSLDMEGLSGPLLKQGDSENTDGGPGFYGTKRESFARIELVEGRYSELNRNMGRWEITTKDGTRYAFGSTANSRLWSCRGTEAWKLDTITDTAGNVIKIRYGHPGDPEHTYHTDHCNVNEGNPDEAQWNETYPLTMTYATNPAAGDSEPEFTVTFGTSRRPYYRESESTILYETQKLDRITLTNAEGHVVREWGFRYEEAVPPDGPEADDSVNVLLKSIAITGTHAANSSGATLPPMTFEYDPPGAARTLDWCLHGTEAGPIQRQYLRAAHNGYGGTVRFDYTYWHASHEDEHNIEYCANGYQVSERRADGGVAGAAPERVDSYGYEAPLIFWDPAAAFIGFENATMTDTVGVVTDNQFYVNPDDPTAARNGVPRRSEVRVAGILRARQSYGYDFNAGKALLLDERRMETEPSGGPRYTRTQHGYDGYGNRTLTTEHGVVYVTDQNADGDWEAVEEKPATEGDERTTTMAYALPKDTAAAQAYILDRPFVRSVYDGLAADEPALVARNFFYYDNAAYGYVGQEGQLTGEAALIDAQSAALTGYGYDDFGNRVVVTDTHGFTTTMGYDRTYRGFATEVTNTLGFKSRTTHDWQKLVVSQVTDVANGDTTSYGYDQWGRVITQTLPGDASPTVQYEYRGPNEASYSPIPAVVTWEREGDLFAPDQDGARGSVAFYDGLGRQIETKVEGPDRGAARPNQYVVTQQMYDARAGHHGDAAFHFRGRAARAAGLRATAAGAT